MSYEPLRIKFSMEHHDMGWDGDELVVRVPVISPHSSFERYAVVPVKEIMDALNGEGTIRVAGDSVGGISISRVEAHLQEASGYFPRKDFFFIRTYYALCCTAEGKRAS